MTRVVIDDMLELVNRSVQLDTPPESDVFYLQPDGLGDEWYAPPASRVDWEENPSDHGAFWPDEWFMSARTFPIRGALWTRSSSLGQARARRMLARLHNRPLSVMVEDEGGTVWVTGASTQRPIITRPSIYRVEFTMFITCPDPIKYGREARYPVTGGPLVVENPGDAPTWPVFYATGPTTVCTIELGDRMVAWHGNAPDGFRLDPRDGLAIDPHGAVVGRLAVDDVFKVPPGTHTLAAASDGPLSVGVRAGWQ